MKFFLCTLHPKLLHMADGDDLGGVITVVENGALDGAVFGLILSLHVDLISEPPHC